MYEDQKTRIALGFWSLHGAQSEVPCLALSSLASGFHANFAIGTLPCMHGQRNSFSNPFQPKTSILQSNMSNSQNNAWHLMVNDICKLMHLQGCDSHLTWQHMCMLMLTCGLCVLFEACKHAFMSVLKGLQAWIASGPGLDPIRIGLHQHVWWHAHHASMIWSLVDQQQSSFAPPTLVWPTTRLTCTPPLLTCMSLACMHSSWRPPLWKDGGSQNLSKDNMHARVVPTCRRWGHLACLQNTWAPQIMLPCWDTHTCTMHA